MMWISQGFVGFHVVSTGIPWGFDGILTGILWDFTGFCGIPRDLWGFRGISRDSAAFSGISPGIPRDLAPVLTGPFPAARSHHEGRALGPAAAAALPLGPGAGRLPRRLPALRPPALPRQLRRPRECPRGALLPGRDRGPGRGDLGSDGEVPPPVTVTPPWAPGRSRGRAKIPNRGGPEHPQLSSLVAPRPS